MSLLVPGCGSTERDTYVKANEALLHELPMFPRSIEVDRSSAEVRTEEEGPVAGYTTTVSFELPRGTTPREVERFYRRRLEADGWMLQERENGRGPVLVYRRGPAIAVVNLESWRGGILELVVDHESEGSRS